MATGNRRKRKRKRPSELLWTTRSTLTCHQLTHTDACHDDTMFPARDYVSLFSLENRCCYRLLLELHAKACPKKSYSAHEIDLDQDFDDTTLSLQSCHDTAHLVAVPACVLNCPHSPRLIDEDSPYGLSWVASSLTKVKFSTDKNSEVSEMDGGGG